MKAKEEITMCSTCDLKNFKEHEENLEQQLGCGNLIIRYDPNNKKFTLGILGEEKSHVIIYRCPTCGRKLY